MILSSVLVLFSIGLTAAIVLSVASRLLHVEEDPRIAMVEGVLAGANCGGCGYPGCAAAAGAVIEGKAGVDVCVIGGPPVAEMVAKIMGLTVVGTIEKKRAHVDCTGGLRAEEIYAYEGVNDCRAQALLYDGAKMCPEGCLGLGTCVRACPFGALSMGENGYPVVDTNLCVACGICARACPRGVIDVHGDFTWLKHPNLSSDCLAPCRQGCPGQINIPKYIQHVKNGDYAGAVLTIKERNPLLLVCGRVCPRPCESHCRRGHVDEPVGINMLKRFVADWEMRQLERLPIPCAPDTDKRIAVIGGGPAGLSCAYFLRRQGHHPTIFESKPALGGQLRYGIPEYRLPKKVLDWEIEGILELGVEAKTGVSFGSDITLEKLGQMNFDAVFLGIGAWANATLRIEGEEAPGVLSGTELLTRIGLQVAPGIGKKVVVVGGGNTAIDCARSSVRLGSEVTMMYRRTKKEMPAHNEEIEGAAEEGVGFQFLAAPTRVVTGPDGHVTGLEYVTMRLGEADASGRRRPEPVPGSETVLECDTIVTAIGQKPELDCLYEGGEECPLETTKWRTLSADPDTLQTGIENVFTAGDMYTGPNLVISAVGGGRKAAASIDEYLMRGSVGVPDKLLRKPMEYTLFKTVEGVAHQERSGMPVQCGIEDRTCTFKEVETALSEDDALYEAGRCMRCGLTCYDRDFPCAGEKAEVIRQAAK